MPVVVVAFAELKPAETEVVGETVPLNVVGVGRIVYVTVV